MIDGDGLIVTLRQLRSFEAVARLRSVNAAASEIRVSQPAVWQAITKVESAFGTALFDRRPTGTYLNAPGEILLARAERFWAQFGAAVNDAAVLPRADPAQLARVQRAITTAQLRTLIAAAEAGTFAEASKELGVSESTLRRAGRALEQTLGRPLFDRSAAGGVLNTVGVELSRGLQVAIVEIRHALEDLRHAEGLITGRVVVGSLPLVQTLFLPRAINMLLESYPEASVDILEGPYALLMQQLRKGSLDVIIGALRGVSPADDIAEESLFVDPFSIVLRKNHPLTRIMRVRLDDLAQYDWVIPRKGTPIRGTFELLFSGCPAPPRANIETSSLSAIRAILAGSNRLTMLSRRQIAIDEEVGLLAVLDYPLPVASRPIGITTRLSWRPPFVQREFLRILRELAGTDSLEQDSLRSLEHDRHEGQAPPTVGS